MSLNYVMSTGINIYFFSTNIFKVLLNRSLLYIIQLGTGCNKSTIFWEVSSQHKMVTLHSFGQAFYFFPVGLYFSSDRKLMKKPDAQYLKVYGPVWIMFLLFICYFC